MELDQIRSKIDEIDEQLLALFCRRMDLSAKVAEYKISAGLPVLRPEREAEIVQNVEAAAEDYREGYGDYAAELFREIMRLSRMEQQKLMESAEADD